MSSPPLPPANADTATSKRASGKSEASSKDRRKSSFFARARMSFVRCVVLSSHDVHEFADKDTSTFRSSSACANNSNWSIDLPLCNRTGGSRGATVEALRGNKGASFEGSGKIARGAEGIGLCTCFGKSGENNNERYFLIKGPFCFVFAKQDASSPKYAVGLQGMKANAQKTTVLLEKILGDVAYEFTFASEQVATEFAAAVQQQAATAQAEMTQKRLGHEHLLQKRSSIVFAEQIAKTKESEQPDAPLSTKEVLANMPTTPLY